MKVNYEKISKIYDDVREEDLHIVDIFINETKIDSNSMVLDVGCGTGNYTNLLKKVTNAQVYGLDQSEGMLEKAKLKNKYIQFVQSSALQTPFDDNMFDLIYMTDVIHHIIDLNQLFLELHRILKPQGKIVILTQSHRQIDLRAMSHYFPETSMVDKKRYPRIEEIISIATENNLNHIKNDIVDEGKEIVLSNSFLEIILKKGYSMLHLISDQSYKEGLDKFKKDLDKGPIQSKSAGGTLVWFNK